MLTGQDLLERLRGRFGDAAQILFRYPFILVEIRDDAFAGVAEPEREEALAARIEIAHDQFRMESDRLFIRFDLGPPGEPRSKQPSVGDFWLRSLVEEPTVQQLTPEKAPGVRTIHFYGYKGGQARSSVLGFLARVLASNGWKILVVDADAEAPSLDVLFRTTVSAPESTAIGVRAGLRPAPLRVASGRGVGHVDLLAFRPSEPRYDLDAAALALEQSLSPNALSKVATSIAGFAKDANYDLMFLDHRTGLSHTILPWVRECPGPIAAFARLDEQWRPARAHLRALWRLGGASDPGVLISFKADSDSVAKYKVRVRQQAESLLDELAAVTPFDSEATEEERLTGEDLADHWVVWSFDPAFVEGEVPAPKDVGGLVHEAVASLRRLLDLGGEPSPVTLHRSGARDEGDLIQTGVLRTLSAPNDVLFVLGRKGTGKTRLVRALSELGVGEPILVADDFAGPGGIKANWPEWKMLAAEFQKTPIRLWWLLYAAALATDGTERSALIDNLERLRGEPLEGLILGCRRAQHDRRRLFLVDGLETAFEQPLTLPYIASLVQFISSIDGDSVFTSKSRLQVFVRTDLAKKGYENFEQLSQGRTLILEWDVQTILNFVLSRIASLEWFKKNFPSAVQTLGACQDEIREAAMESEEAERLLLEVFPERLRRLNLKMTTYLRTYFSDDPSGQRSFYPRIYDEFLGTIAGDHKGLSGAAVEGAGKKKRVGQQLIYMAHERSTAKFLDQVRSELKYLVEVSDAKLDRVIEAFRGTRTPFRLDARVGEVAERTKISKADVRLAMDQMLSIGIFEVREGHEGQWRVGRLFKSSLGMLYARGDRRVS